MVFPGMIAAVPFSRSEEAVNKNRYMLYSITLEQKIMYIITSTG